MKLYLSILYLALCLFGKMAISQSITEYSCGTIFYSYDNAGNRIVRQPYGCTGGGDDESAIVHASQDSSEGIMEEWFPLVGGFEPVHKVLSGLFLILY